MPTSDAQRVRNIRWYSIPENRAKVKEKSRLRYIATKESGREQRKSAGARYRTENAETLREKSRLYMQKRRATDSETLNERTRQWRANNPGCNTRQIRKYRGLPEPTRPCPDVCENCGGPPTGRGGFHLDHDHKNGRFRGWLCHKCNGGMGMLGDDIFGLQRAILYLHRSLDA